MTRLKRVARWVGGLVLGLLLLALVWLLDAAGEDTRELEDRWP